MFNKLKFIRWSILLRILIVICIVTSLFGYLLTLIEPNTFKTIGDGIWWAFITIATVGYGDFAPKTTLGRLLGIILVLVGAGIFSAYFATVVSSIVRLQNAALKGEMMITEEEHMVIVGWNGRARNVIDQLLRLETVPFIVLIDETLKQNPYQHAHVKFLKGQPYSDSIIIKANIAHSKFVLITADQNQTEKHADMMSIMTLLAIKGLYPNVYCIVEVLSKNHLSNAKRAGADEIIQTNIQASYAMVNAALSHGMSNTILSLLDYFQENHLTYMKPEETWVGLTIQQLRATIAKKRYILIGIQHIDKSIKINPEDDLIIQADDQLLVILN